MNELRIDKGSPETPFVFMNIYKWEIDLLKWYLKRQIVVPSLMVKKKKTKECFFIPFN